MDKAALIHIGRITKSFGTQGEIIVELLHEDTGINENEPVFLAIEGTRVPFFITSFKKRTDDRLQLGLDEINSPELAGPLLNADVYVERSSLPPPEEGQMLIADLVGFSVVDIMHGQLGEITDILVYPEQDMMIIEGQDKELMIPLVEAYIISIDPEKKEISLSTPEGLIDLLRNGSE